MCYHNTLKKKAKDLVEYYESSFEQEDLFQEIYHGVGFTFPQWPIVTHIESRKIELGNWGLIPSWAYDTAETNTYRSTNLNAKSETIFEKASFKHAIKNQRCLIPSTGFIEWQDAFKKKFPYFIFLKNRDLFSMGGIYNEWQDASSKQTIKTFAIITTEANKMMSEIHNTKKRMPFILSKKNEDTWLNPTLSTHEITQLMLPFDTQEMKSFTIGKLASSFASKHSNIPEVLQPYNYPDFQQGSLF